METLTKSWQEQCADIVEFLETYIPDTEYRIIMRRTRIVERKIWRLIVESVRADHGPHHGTPSTWMQVEGDDLERLPEKLMDKARQRIYDFQKEQLDIVQRLAGDLQRAREELDKRLNASSNLEKLQQAVEGTKGKS